jgi:hypothetical protein
MPAEVNSRRGVIRNEKKLSVGYQEINPKPV